MTFQEKMDKFLEEYVPSFKLNGSLRVTVRDQVIYEKFMGYADLDTGKKIDKDSIFAFYSLSKPFCAIGLLKLRDKGIVDIDAHPSKYIPELAELDPRVTIRHMLHHVSGVPDLDRVRFAVDESGAKTVSESIRAAFPSLCREPMLFAPGEKHVYMNINFVVPAIIIENVTGMPYAEYMKKEVLEPLGARNARVIDKYSSVNGMVRGCELHDGELVHVPLATFAMLGAGDIVGTVDDAYRLNHAIKHRLLLSENTWNEALTPSPVSSMGQGCTVSTWHGRERITHNGGHTGFRTIHIQLRDDDFDIILLSNSGWGNARNEIAEAVYSAYYGADDKKSDTINMDGKYISK